MRHHLLHAAILLLAPAFLSARQSSATPVPVVVELFTSEGCSSCPPADAVLSRLVTQGTDGVQIIPIGMHVTYWDRLGWKDPASQPMATARQQDYSRVFGEDRVYTPQAVVDGRAELVGSDETAVRRAIADAARQPHARVALDLAVRGDQLSARAAIEGLPATVKERLTASLIVTEDGLSSVVTRGENGGRTLRHDAVARVISTVDVSAGQPLEFQAALKPGWHRDRLHAVVLLQGKSSRRIWGAAIGAVK